jgi:hypothetical protein
VDWLYQELYFESPDVDPLAYGHPVSRLGRWEGYVVTEDWNEARAGQSVWVIRLETVRGQPRCCSGCCGSTAAIHDLEERRVSDLPVFEHRVELLVPRVRVRVRAAVRSSSDCPGSPRTRASRSAWRSRSDGCAK